MSSNSQHLKASGHIDHHTLLRNLNRLQSRIWTHFDKKNLYMIFSERWYYNMFPAYAFFRCLFQLFPKKETIEIKKVCLKFTKDFCTIRSKVQVRIWTQGNVVIISTCKKICSRESVPSSSKPEDLIYFVEFRPAKSKVRSVSTWGQDQFSLEKKNGL